MVRHREALEHVLTNVLELSIKSTIWETLIHNYCDCIEDLVNIADTDVTNLCWITSTKSLEFLSIGHHNLIWVFISYLRYLIHDNDPIGDDWVKFTKDDFNEFRVTVYNS